jgi:hypothetical protein
MVKQQQRELALLHTQTDILRNRLAHVEQSNANRGRVPHHGNFASCLQSKSTRTYERIVVRVSLLGLNTRSL